MARVVTNGYIEEIYTKYFERCQIPGASSIKYDGLQFVFRDLLVKLDDVSRALKTISSQSIVFVYADVVILPTENWSLSNTTLFIVARHIVANSGKHFLFDYRYSENVSFVIYTAEVEGSLEIKTLDSQEHLTVYDLSQFDSLGVQISFKNGSAIRRDLTYIGEELLEFGKDLWMSLSSIFQFSTVILDSQPEVASSMLRWIKTVTCTSRVAKDLYLQSSAFLSQMTLLTSKVCFVPSLNPNIYVGVIEGYAKAGIQYDNQYQIFRLGTENKEQWSEAARQMQQYFKLTSDFNQYLIDQATKNVENSQLSIIDSTAHFNTQKLNVDQAAIKFKYGVEKWKDEMIKKSIFNISISLIEFVGGISLIAVGDEAAGISAAQSIEKATKAAAEAGDSESQAVNTSQMLKRLAENMKSLKAIEEAVATTYKFINSVLKETTYIESASNFDNLKENVSNFDDVTLPSDNDISCQAEWDAFQIEADNLLKVAIETGIDGASEYNVALDKLAIYGKALSATKSSYIHSAQELAQLHMQNKIGDNMQSSLAEYIQKLNNETKPDETMMFLFYVHDMNIKRWMYIAIQSYTQAYRYWALQESKIKPSLFENIQDLQEDLATIEKEYADALDSFNPHPQSFGGFVGRSAIKFEITDESTLNEFKNNKLVHFIFPLDSEQFEDYDRVRLSTIRVWLHGITENNEVKIRITNSGTYFDRFKGKEFCFTSTPLDRIFNYNGAPEDEKAIIIDGCVSDREKDVYFEPTPFSGWQISLPYKSNEYIDLSGLAKITISFAGSLIEKSTSDNYGQIREGNKTSL